VLGAIEIPEELAKTATGVHDALTLVRDQIDAALAPESPALAELCGHVSELHGKMLRPVFTLLSGLATDPGVSAAPGAPIIKAAAVVEMIHVATLVHDDVLDDADVRRGARTLNRLRGNEAAVMLGDYLFAAAYRLCASIGDATLAERVGEVCMRVCAGELLQLDHRENWSVTETDYDAIVEGKTGALLGGGAELGARIAGADDDSAAAMFSIGIDLGVAFQIRDDLLDLLADTEQSGKTSGLDAATGKATLPIIHHLAHAPPETRGDTLRMLDHAAKREPDRRGLVLALRSSGSIQHAESEAERRIDRAVRRLEHRSESPARSLLILLAQAVLERTH